MLTFTPTPISGAWVIDLAPIEDERGFFSRAFDTDAYVEHGIDPRIAQMNMSHTLRAGTVRGFHWQEAPHAETKTLRTLSGATYNVIVDVRPDSSSYGNWFGVELSPENLRVLCVPEGVGNGFQTLKDDSRVLYQVSRPYHPDAVERGVRFDDPVFSVEWPTDVTVVSEKDLSWPAFNT